MGSVKKYKQSAVLGLLKHNSREIPNPSNKDINPAESIKNFDLITGRKISAWVRKYKDKGIEGLYDRRGKNKAISQLSDIEKLKAENRLLKAQTQQQQMEIDFLKKLDEIERR